MISVSGLQYTPNYLEPDHERRLLETVDSLPWLDDLKRRVQHYGYKYDYTARKVDPDMYLGPLPEWAAALGRKLLDDGLFPQLPDQLIVNEYQPGQGISPHVDCEPCFADTIASITLGSGCDMNLIRVEDGHKLVQYLERRSIIVMKDEARYHWRHAIPARKSDVRDQQRALRGRRVSLTFRNVQLGIGR